MAKCPELPHLSSIVGQPRDASTLSRFQKRCGGRIFYKNTKPLTCPKEAWITWLALKAPQFFHESLRLRLAQSKTSVKAQKNSGVGDQHPRMGEKDELCPRIWKHAYFKFVVCDSHPCSFLQGFCFPFSKPDIVCWDTIPPFSLPCWMLCPLSCHPFHYQDYMLMAFVA